MRSNAAKFRYSCAGVAMPAWCAPWNGTHRGEGAARARRSARADGPVEADAEAERDRAAEHLATAEAGVRCLSRLAFALARQDEPP